MSQWGVFHDDAGDAHVAPCLPDGRMTLRHWLRKNCSCGPKVERSRKIGDDGYALDIYVHQDHEAGGTDA